MNLAIAILLCPLISGYDFVPYKIIWSFAMHHLLLEPEVGVTGNAGTCVTVKPVGYASFFGSNVTMRNREPGCVANLRNHT